MQQIVQQGEDQALRSRIQVFQRFDENPLEAESGLIEEANCFKVKGIPGPAFNKVRHLNGEKRAAIKDIEAWYGNTRFQIEVTPYEANKKLFHSLHKNDFYQTGFHSSFMGRTIKVAESALTTSIEIRPLGEKEFEDFADVYVKSFGLPDSIKEGVRQNNECLRDAEGWSFVKAVDKGAIAGIAAVYVENNVAVLASSAVLPAFRGKGIQRALIKKRAEIAKQAGAAYITGEAAFSSASHRNMIQCGLELVYTKALYNKVT
ncbi:GNAT family N-acetyltransferase [Jeotgalibacillus campisalis]|uniref:N-acetyltransferase domain-containing protein n=1 Tax=Jeotgalibacillus campisalis TaxID=220754 RepID=A0A0C2SA69_9BACL|nr:GNAT family N-acetyltransferase [Jeotgalibacillus campisalis]KIL50869.1 hypothetical protein KR50_07500 [Jeotgalibacillus campisalis]